MVIIAIWIKRDSEGPVFYRQERVTAYGKHFRIHKYRTMINNADKIGSTVTVSDDARITKVGKKLRDLRIDEIVLLRKECGLIRVYRKEDERWCLTNMNVADSIDEVIDGTSSAGRIYDRFELAARAGVLFIYHRIAIARVVEWDYVEEGE